MVVTVRQRVTWLVVGALAVLATLAVADALRSGEGSGESREPGTSTVSHPPGRPTLAGTLGRDAIQGQLIYNDPECRLRTILLPSLERDEVVSDRTGKELRLCRFSLAAGHFLSGKVAMTQEGRLIARGSSFPLRVSVSEFAWLEEHRVVAILHASGRGIRPEEMLVLLDGGHLTGVDVRFEGPMRNLVVSPGGAYAADEPGTLMRARDGRSWALPRSLGIEHVLAFSPDERWLAVGTRTSVFLISVTNIERNEPEPRIDRIPIAAQELVWEPGGAPTGTSTTAR